MHCNSIGGGVRMRVYVPGRSRRFIRAPQVVRPVRLWLGGFWTAGAIVIVTLLASAGVR